MTPNPSEKPPKMPTAWWDGIGAFIGVVSLTTFYFRVDTATGRLVATVIGLMIVIGIALARRIWGINRQTRWFAVLAASTVALLIAVLSAVLSTTGTAPPNATPEPTTQTQETRPSESASSETATEAEQESDETVYLDSLEVIGYTDLNPSTAVVNGVTYEHALVNSMETWVTCGDAQSEHEEYALQGGSTEYNLERKYEEFRVTVGLTDDSSSGGTYKFWVYGDEELIGSASAALGEPAQLEVDVRDVLRLKLVQNDCGNSGGVVWADPILIPAG